jgi:hypothetical protein
LGRRNQERVAFLIGRARLRRAVTFSYEIDSGLDGVSPYRGTSRNSSPVRGLLVFPVPTGLKDGLLRRRDENAVLIPLKTAKKAGGILPFAFPSKRAIVDM